MTLLQRRYAMVLLTVVYMFNFIDRQILSILLPAIKAEFAVSDAFLGWLSGTAFALFYVTLGIPIGYYADRANRRNLIAGALALWSAMTAVCGLAMNVWHLLLARIGVGVGEAGCSPPAHSIISDLYPPTQRSAAMGFYSLGISAGIMFAFLAGGWVVENIGWREAFFVVGAPGIVLAVIVRLTLPEPARGASESRSDSGASPSFSLVFRFLLQRRSFVHLSLAAGLASFVGYATISFIPTFMARSFDWGMAKLGFWLGLIVGIVGGVGYFFGGLIADRLGRAGFRRSMFFIAIAMLLTSLFFAAMLLATTPERALLLFMLPILTMNAYLAPSFSLTQGLVSLRMRALASAIMLLVINVIGLGLGPWLTGELSDYLTPRFGAEAMRYALLTVTSVLLPWAAWHFFLSGRAIDADLSRATEHD